MHIRRFSRIYPLELAATPICPICLDIDAQEQVDGVFRLFSCKNCGKFAPARWVSLEEFSRPSVLKLAQDFVRHSNSAEIVPHLDVEMGERARQRSL